MMSDIRFSKKTKMIVKLEFMTLILCNLKTTTNLDYDYRSEKKNVRKV
jgi:hypothetical protein